MNKTTSAKKHPSVITKCIKLIWTIMSDRCYNQILNATMSKTFPKKNLYFKLKQQNSERLKPKPPFLSAVNFVFSYHRCNINTVTLLNKKSLTWYAQGKNSVSHELHPKASWETQ